MTAHALLSASGSKRWMACTPSPRLEATLPEPKKNPNAFDYSAEGTMAHELAEAKLRLFFGKLHQTEYEEIYNTIKQSQYFNDDFEQHVDDYVLYVRSQIGDADRPMFEQRVDYSEWVPEGFGTADVVILSQTKVRVIDLKFGAGIPVDAKDNPQLRLYALGAWSKFKEEFPDIRQIEYTIHQPRLGSITTDHTTLDKLVEWAQYFVRDKAKKAWVGAGDFVPGDHCQFCRAKAQCKARSDFVSEIAKLDFKPAPLLTDDEMATLLSKGSQLKSYVDDVEGYLTDKAATTGVPPKGFILSSTSTHRKLKDEQLAIEVLKEHNITDVWEPVKIKSLAQLEKLGPKNRIAGILGDLIYRPEGKPKLVPMEDFK